MTHQVRTWVLTLFWALFAFNLLALAPDQSRATEAMKLRMGDVVIVALPGEAAINKEFQVDSRGQILLPEVGLIRIADMTLDQATVAVRTMLSRAFKDLDRLRVIIKERRLLIKVSGYVKSAGTVSLPDDATVQTAISAAGGLSQGAQLDRFRIRRKGKDIEFNYKRFLDTGDSSIVPQLEPLDELFVPSSPVTGNVQVEFDGRTLMQAGDGGEERNSIKIIGEVRTPAAYSYKPGATVVDMLLRAGGVTQYASVQQIRIINNGEPSAFNLQTYLDTGNKSLMPDVQSGATIFVPRQTEEIKSGGHTVYVMGEVARPGAFESKPGATFVDILANSGGPTRYAETRQMRVLRSSGAVEMFDMVKFTEGEAVTLPKIQPGDAIFVPEKVQILEPSWLRFPPGRVIHIIGAVVKPGRYEWSDEMSLFDALSNAGGPHARADLTSIEIMKSEGETAKTQKFDLQNFMSKGGPISAVPVLKAGNVVHVPELPVDPNDNKSLWVRQSPERSIYIMGSVGKPGRYAFNKSLGFLDALSAADGPTPNADLRNVRVAHRNRRGSKVTNVNLARYFAVGDETLIPKVRPGDVIFVPDRNKEWLDEPKEATVRVLGAVMKPGRYRFADDMTVLDLLAEAGGPTPIALQSRILVVNMGRVEQARQFDLLAFAKTADTRMLPVVRNGDMVYVPDQSQSEVKQTIDFIKDIVGIVATVKTVLPGSSNTTATVLGTGGLASTK